MSYKDEQKKTRELLKKATVIKDYRLNSDVPRSRRRGRRLYSENVQTFVKADDPVSDLVSYDSVTNTVTRKSAQSDPKRKANT